VDYKVEGLLRPQQLQILHKSPSLQKKRLPGKKKWDNGKKQQNYTFRAQIIKKQLKFIQLIISWKDLLMFADKWTRNNMLPYFKIVPTISEKINTTLLLKKPTLN
jgi:hypothetical protein